MSVYEMASGRSSPVKRVVAETPDRGVASNVVVGADGPAAKDGSRVKCFNCNKPGHRVGECPLPRNDDAVRLNRDAFRRNRGVPTADLTQRLIAFLDAAEPARRTRDSQSSFSSSSVASSRVFLSPPLSRMAGND
jgi:hypothetical protein